MNFKKLVRGVSYKLFGIEHPRLVIEQQWEKIKYVLLSPVLRDPVLYSDLEDCIVRIRISDRCNCKCKWCALKCLVPEKATDMDPKWINEYCKPLYEKAKVICFTHGEFLMAPGAFELFENISDNFPQATISTESNGIGFNEKWQKLAADHLFMTSFSLNSVSEKIFLQGVWEKDAPGGEAAFRISRKNVNDFIHLLEQRGLLAFAPGVCMVISSETVCEAVDFIRMALEMKVGHITFFLEVTEFPSATQCIENQDVHNTLIEIEKIASVLKEKFRIQYDMYIPWGEAAMVKEAASKYTREQIEEQYKDILALAEKRSIVREYEERQAILKANGKKTFGFDESERFFASSFDIRNKKVCRMAWKEIDLSTNGDVQFCGWQRIPMANILDHLKDDKVDWMGLYNSAKIRYIRKKMLDGDYFSCMKCCPVIPMVAREKIK